MNKIPLLDLIQKIDGAVILKISETFPNYERGDDLDLLVLDRSDAIRAIYKFAEKVLENGIELRVTDTPGHCHADFLFDGGLEIRIDLIDNFEFYSKLAVKNGFVAKIFKDRRARSCGDLVYYVPSEEDNLTIRYFEYLEWFDRRPDKVKHMDYICAVEDESLKRRFFENTHRFIRFKRKTWVEPAKMIERTGKMNSRRQALRNILESFHYLVKATTRIWFKKFSGLFRKT